MTGIPRGALARPRIRDRQATALGRRCGRQAVIPVLLVALLLAGCGTLRYQGASVDNADFLRRAIIQENGPMRVTAAVPDADETALLTGLDLYAQGIQPIWLKVENRGSKPARIALWSIDRDYYAPIEVAYTNRSQFSSEGYVAMERWFLNNGLTRQVPPGESRSGLVFTHHAPGTKGFNLDIFSNRASHNFTFFVPLSGFTADYTLVDFTKLYQPEEIRQLDPYRLKSVLEDELPCCAQGPAGEKNGGAFNIALVGTPLAIRRALLRGGWLETRAGAQETVRARAQRFDGRPPDTIFYLDRKDGNERMVVHFWRAPWEVDGEPGWVGQVYYRSFEESFVTALSTGKHIRDSAFLPLFVRESVSADIDGPRSYLLQNFWYTQSLGKMGTVKGVGEATEEDPLVTFDGLGFVTSGNRSVLFVSETPVAMGETEVLYGRESIVAGSNQ